MNSAFLKRKIFSIILLNLLLFALPALPTMLFILRPGLLEPSESKIVSAAATMAETGNYFEPVVNGQKDFSSPPLTYWLTSAGISLFGKNEFAARYFLTFAIGVAALSVYHIANIFFGMQTALLSWAVLLSSLLFQMFFSVISFDAYEAAIQAFTALTFFHWMYKPAPFKKYVFWTMLGIGVLNTGLISLLPAAIIVSVALYTGEKKRVSGLIFSFKGLAIFLAVTLPWYMVAFLSHRAMPDMAFSVLKLLADSNTGPFNRFFHSFFVLFAGLFPWSLFILYTVKKRYKELRYNPSTTYLFSWAFVPLVFYTLAAQKNLFSILPAFAPLSILIAREVKELFFRSSPSSKTNRRQAALAILITTTVCGITSIIIGYKNLAVSRIMSTTALYSGIFWLFGATVIFAALMLSLYKTILLVTSLLVPGFLLFLLPAALKPSSSTELLYYPNQKELVQKMNLAVSPLQPVVAVNGTINSWPFYSDRPLKYYSDKIETLPESLDENIEYINFDQLNELLKNPVLIVLPEGEKADFLKRFDLAVEEYTSVNGWSIFAARHKLASRQNSLGF